MTPEGTTNVRALFRGALIGAVLVGLLGCGPKPGVPQGTASAATPAATALAATTAPLGSAAPTPAASTAGGSACADIAALKAALDMLAALDPDTAPKTDLVAAATGVSAAASALIIDGQATKSTHLRALQIGASLTLGIINERTVSEAKQGIEQELNTGKEVLTELGSCP